MTIEIDNAKEEIKEIIEKCINCGLCKFNCPVYRILREEKYSPRGKAILLNNDYFNKLIYNCTLCKACEESCPLKLKLCDAFLKLRKILIGQGKGFLENKKIIKNLSKSDNIFGL